MAYTPILPLPVNLVAQLYNNGDPCQCWLNLCLNGSVMDSPHIRTTHSL